jgi:hypothetical protein
MTTSFHSSGASAQRTDCCRWRNSGPCSSLEFRRLIFQVDGERHHSPSVPTTTLTVAGCLARGPPTGGRFPLHRESVNAGW